MKSVLEPMARALRMLRHGCHLIYRSRSFFAQRQDRWLQQLSVPAVTPPSLRAPPDHSELPPDEPYEAFIARTMCIPTRENLHDLLQWAHPG